MILGMSKSALSLMRVVLRLIRIFSGGIVLSGMFGTKRLCARCYTTGLAGCTTSGTFSL
jgi:hypothetical protein